MDQAIAPTASSESRATCGRRRAARFASVVFPRGSLLATDVLHDLPSLECGFDGQKISRFAIIGVLFHGSARPCESATPCNTKGIFSKNLCQRLRELTISCRDVGARTHDLSPIWDISALHFRRLAVGHTAATCDDDVDLTGHQFRCQSQGSKTADVNRRVSVRTPPTYVR
jgi:hypothetical protein